MLNRKSYTQMAVDLVQGVLTRGGHLRCQQGFILADGEEFRAYRLDKEDDKVLYIGTNSRHAAEFYVKHIGGFDAIGQAIKFLREKR
jgi:hypothetical protein